MLLKKTSVHHQQSQIKVLHLQVFIDSLKGQGVLINSFSGYVSISGSLAINKVKIKC